jgi:hypothetical protein
VQRFVMFWRTARVRGNDVWRLWVCGRTSAPSAVACLQTRCWKMSAMMPECPRPIPPQSSVDAAWDRFEFETLLSDTSAALFANRWNS